MIKGTNMNTQEHMIAVVEPARDGESTIELAKEVVYRGGGATVVVLVTPHTAAAIAEFADAEDMTFPNAKALYVERIADVYSSRFGDHRIATIVTDRRDPYNVVFDTAGQTAATVVAIPQRMATQRSWRATVARSEVSVLIAPPKAA
jgi:hypothetical protein